MSLPASKLNEPSILLAGSNCQKLLRNLSHILDESSLVLLRNEIDRNVVALLDLGREHFDFAAQVVAVRWRQKTSRLYYAAFNTKRAVSLHHSGAFSTDVSDHKNISSLPPDFPRSNTHATRLNNLRDDRNIADYSHVAQPTDLIVGVHEAENFVRNFIEDSRSYLASRGLQL